MKAGVIKILTSLCIYAGSISATSVFRFANSISLVNRRRLYVDSSFNAMGNIPEIENAELAVSRCPPIVALRCANATVVAWTQRYPIDHCRIRLLGPGPLSAVLGTQFRLLQTGLAADCRYVLKVIFEFVNSLPIVPRGIAISDFLSNHLHLATLGSDGRRPLACHSFIVDTGKGELFEVDLAGTSRVVLGGVAGQGAQEGLRRLERSFRVNMNETEGKALAEEVIAVMNDGRGRHNTTKIMVDVLFDEKQEK
jgi:hypothetical protein